MEQPRIPISTKAILLAGILLGGYIASLIGLVYVGQRHLRQSLFDQAQLAIEKQAAAVGYFLSEQQDEINELTRNPTLNSFFANRALGMSMQYGLRASLQAVRGELEGLLSRKKLLGRPVYSCIKLVDRDGSVLVTTGEETKEGTRDPDWIPEYPQGVSLHLLINAENAYISHFYASIDYRDQVAGFIIAEMNPVNVLPPLLKQSVNGKISNKLMLMGPKGEVLISTGLNDSSRVTAENEDMIVVPVPGSEYTLRGTVELGYGQYWLTSSWFLAALALITFPVLGGVYFLFRLNNKHLILQSRYLSSRRQQKKLQHYRKLLDLSTDLIVVIDPETSHYLDVNQTMCDFFGISREELLNKRFIDLSGKYQTIEQWRKFLKRLREQDRFTTEDTGLRPNGQPFFIEINAHYARDAEQDSIVAIFRDISERKQAERVLRKANHRVTAVLDGIDAAVYVADMETYEVLYTNTKVKNMFGDVIGKKCWQSLQTGQDGPCPFCPNDKLLDEDGKPAKTHIWEFQNPESGLWFHCSNRAIPWDDGRYVHLQVATDISSRIQNEKALKKAHQQLKSLAYYDPLTKLANRRLFVDRLHHAFSRADRTSTKLAICYLDLDGFKQINDTYGHESGDNLLIQVSDRLQNALRGEDTVARWGGDEFALLIGGQNTKEDCILTLKRLIDILSAPYELKGHIFHVTASVGVTIYPQDSGDPDTLLRHADQAMYIAKQRGRNCYYLFDPDQDRHSPFARSNSIP